MSYDAQMIAKCLDLAEEINTLVVSKQPKITASKLKSVPKEPT